MKAKLTLSIDRKRLNTLRTLSRIRRRSISALVEEYADEAAKKERKPEPLFSEKWADVFQKMGRSLTLEECEADDKLGAELRKTQAYADLKAASKRKRKA